MVRQRVTKLKRVAFVSLLENILIQKKKRIVKATAIDFMNHVLVSKGFKGLKRLWLKQSKEKIMNKVAKEFYLKIRKRRDLRKKKGR